jgi:hypothetical protein
MVEPCGSSWHGNRWLKVVLFANAPPTTVALSAFDQPPLWLFVAVGKGTVMFPVSHACSLFMRHLRFVWHFPRMSIVLVFHWRTGTLQTPGTSAWLTSVAAGRDFSSVSIVYAMIMFD